MDYGLPHGQTVPNPGFQVLLYNLAHYKTLLKGRMLIFVKEYIGLCCPGRGGWDLLKYQIAMNIALNIPAAF